MPCSTRRRKIPCCVSTRRGWMRRMMPPWPGPDGAPRLSMRAAICRQAPNRSEEHTSELQSRRDLVCRPPSSTLFPYTTLFRSLVRTLLDADRGALDVIHAVLDATPEDPLLRFYASRLDAAHDAAVAGAGRCAAPVDARGNMSTGAEQIGRAHV